MRLASNAQSEADKAVSEVLEQVGNAVVAPGAAPDGQPQPAQLQGDVVVGHDKRGGLDAVIARVGPEGLPALVHVERRTQKHHRTTLQLSAGYLTAGGLFHFPGKAQLPRQLLHDEGSEIMTGTGIVRPGISQTGDDGERHDGKEQVNAPGARLRLR